MKKTKWYTYVAVQDNNNAINYVTSVDDIRKLTYWESNKDAMPMTLTGAKSLVECLRANGFRALLIQLPGSVAARNR